LATTGTLPQLLTIDQLAEQLGTSTRHVRRLVAERRVPYLKVGKFVRFDPAEIAVWLDRSRVAGRPSGTTPGADHSSTHQPECDSRPPAGPSVTIRTWP
jgi:excisionase family DNA binding protein